MRLTITLDCDNAAFDDDPIEEIERILAKDCVAIVRGFLDGDRQQSKLYDINGNACGDIRMRSEAA